MEKVLHQFGVLESVFLEQIIATSAQVTPNGLVRKSIQKGLNSDQGTPLQKKHHFEQPENTSKKMVVFSLCVMSIFFGG